MKKGIIQIIPILILSLALTSGLVAIAISNQPPTNSQRVLSSSDDSGGDDSSGSGSNSGSSGSGSGSSDSDSSDDNDDNSNSSSSNSGSSGSENTTKVESRTGDSRTKIETSSGKTKVETRNGNSRFETKVEDGKQETKLRFGGLRIEYKEEDGKIVAKIKNEDDEEVELEDEEEDELLDELENELDDDDIKIATDSAELGIIQNGRKIRTNFPLSVNPQTGELTVSTPSGDKVVTVLPAQAIQNMIAAGFPIITTVGTTPTEGTESAQVEEAEAQLTEVNNELAYLIDAAKNERFLGLLPVTIKVRGVVSAGNGSVIELRRSFLSRLTDLLSF